MSSVESKIEAVLFDMDGTLINSEPYWLISETSLMARYGHTWSDENQAFCLGGPLPKVGAYMSSLSDGAEGAEYFERELVRLVAEEFKRGLEFIPGARELVAELSAAGIPMALVSASPRLLVDSAIDLLPEGTFVTSISSEDVKVSKPDPESYLLAAERIKVDIANCIVLEDSKTGISSGLASGAVVVGIPHLISFPPSPRLHLRKDLVGLTSRDLEIIFQQESQEDLDATRV